MYIRNCFRGIGIIVILVAFCLLWACSGQEVEQLNKHKQQQSIEVVNKSEFVNSDVEDIVEPNIDLNKILLKDGLKDETLVKKGTNEEGWDISSINLKGDFGLTYQNVLVCKDFVYDVVYVINYGYDNFIYRIKNDQMELVVDIPAKSIFTRDGILYFIVESYHIYTFEDIEDGNVLSYNPITGEVRKVIDEVVDYMAIYKDGIYIANGNTGTYQSKASVNQYNFNMDLTMTSIEGEMSLLQLDDYNIYLQRIFPENDENEFVRSVVIKSKDMSKSIHLGDYHVLFNVATYKQQLYGFIGTSKLLMYTMGDEEPSIIDISKYKTQRNYMTLAKGDYTVIDDRIYYFEATAFPLDDLAKIYISAEQNKAVYRVYTDGSNLYGVIDNIVGGSIETGKLMKIKLQDELRDEGSSSRYRMIFEEFQTNIS